MSETFSERLKVAMRASGFNVTKLAERAGIDKGSVSHYLSGRYTPKQDRIFKMAQVLDVNENWLMGLDVPQSRHVDHYSNVTTEDGQESEILRLTNTEIQVIKKYREASDRTKEAIKTLLDVE